MSRARAIIEQWNTTGNPFEQLIQAMGMDEGVYDQSALKAIFLAGGPGSGKSFVADSTTSGHGFKVVNSDEAFEIFMKKAGLSLDMTQASPEETEQKDAIRGRAKKVTDKRLDLYVGGRMGLVIDGTGREFDKIAKQRAQLEQLGYDTYMIYVNTSLDVALERNQQRERKVPEELVRKFWQDVQNNMGAFQRTFKANFSIVDNSSYDNAAIIADVWKQVRKFSQAPVKNPVGKAWIEAELAKKNTLGA